MTGDIGGQTVFLLATPAGLRLAERMLRRKRGTSQSLGQLEQSALKEAGNILAGAYLTALSEFLGMTSDAVAAVIHNRRFRCTRSARSAITRPRAESPILCVETEFFLEEPVESLHGFFLLVPDSRTHSTPFSARCA